ncbi:MAG: DNA polymerase IV, partial [Bacillota bacterium]
MSASGYNNLQRSIIHVDADAFFASVEQRDDPSLRGKPVIVGSDPKTRGVVSTCSYEARSFGVHSAMPSYQAYKLCPQGIFIKPRMKRYQEVSNAMFEIFSRYSPIVEKVSIDEGFIDVSGADGQNIAICIRNDVKNEIGITVTAGVSYCKYLAKIASDLAKPDGLMVITPDRAYSFLSNLPVSRLPGIGPKTQAKLVSMGISTVGVMRQMSEDWFEDVFGKRGRRVRELCFGIDDEPVTTGQDVKSVSEEMTFAEDIIGIGGLKPHLADLCQNVCFRLRRSRLKCKTVGVKVRFSDFSTITREQTLHIPVSSDAELFSLAVDLLGSVSLDKPVRLLGVVAKGLVPENNVQPM